jgi:hypothetical protein
VDYLLDTLDHRHQPRAVQPELLRGDPEMTKLLIDSIPYTQRYTSGVLSFAPEESPEVSPELTNRLMDSFEQMVAPGIPKDHLCWLWVQHSEHGRFELHWVVPNVELESGKRFAPYYDRADRPRFVAWQKYQNLSCGLADPQEPFRSRAVAVSRWLPQDGKDNATALNRILEQMCVAGELRTRQDMIRFLEKTALVRVPRQGKDYITVQYGEAKHERFRLRGAIYHEDYRFEDTIAADAIPARTSGPADREPSLRALHRRLEELTERRKTYLGKRFRCSAAYIRRTTREDQEPDRERDQTDDLAAEISTTSDGYGLPRRSGAGIGMVPSGRPPAGADGALVRERENLPDRERARVDAMHRRHDSAGISGEDKDDHSTGLQASGVGEHGTDKRTRNAAAGFVDTIKQRIRGARAAHLGGIRSLHEIVQRAGQLFEGAIREGIAAVERLDRALRGSHEAIEELERTSRQLRDQAQTLKKVRARDSKALERD